MMDVASLWTKFTAELAEDPLLTISLSAALAAFASAPLAVAVLGRMDWFQARRGRVLQRPSFVSVVVGMMLVMSIPAIFAALVLKSRRFDENRYEFNPNRTWSVLEQGRGFKDLKEADAAVKQEMERLALERKNLVEGVKKLDQSMLALRAASGTSAAVAQTIPGVLQSLAQVRQSVNLDGPQQLMDFTAPPVDVRSIAVPAAVAAVAAPVASAPAPAPAPVNGLTPAQVEAELAAVPGPQKPIAAMLPLTDVPAGWVVEKSGEKYVETFNADNLYEKIDGRAESFVQYGVTGMAYTYYHPADDDSKEVQLYIFEMADPLRALGKFGSEKPDGVQSVELGDGGYTSAGSTFLYAGKYYTQLVSTQDDPKFAAFAMEIARRVAASQKPGSAPPAVAASTPAPAAAPPAASTPAPAVPAATASAEMSPADYFRLLPTAGRQSDPTYVPQDVFGYSFFTDVFMADYKEGEVGWQGFLRPYKDAEEAKTILDRYVSSVKEDGAEVKTLQAEGADAMVWASNIGLFDVIFRKGNVLAGANGATTAEPAEAFARALAKSLPERVQPLGGP